MKIELQHTGRVHNGKVKIFHSPCTVRIGRNGENDFIMDDSADIVVSGFHASIDFTDDEAIIYDQDSTNGVFVNNKKINRTRLQSDDNVTLGENGPGFKVIFGLENKRKTVTKFGKSTVGLMVQNALMQAGLLAKKGTTKSTDYFEALMESKIRYSIKKLRGLYALSAFVIILFAGIVLYYLTTEKKDVEISKINRAADEEGSHVAKENRHNIFMLAGFKISGETRVLGFCTAFAIKPTVLATNAHCIEEATLQFKEVFVLMNGMAGKKFKVVKMEAHPEYKKNVISPDVGLLKIKAKLAGTVKLASKKSLKNILPGRDVYLYGFPGRLNKLKSPVATIIKGNIGRVTTFSLDIGIFKMNTLLQHSAYTTKGTSGSPLFNTDGEVIGVGTGGYMENGKPLTGYNFAMRVDLLNEIMHLL